MYTADEMICPQCKAEYRQGFTRCVDCDVDLVHETPPGNLANQEIPQPGDPNEDPFCSFWKGDDPRVHVELCSVLDEAGIPHHSVYRREHLFNFRNSPEFEVGVPFSLFEKAEVAVRDAFGADEYDAMKLLEAPATDAEKGNISGSMPGTVTPEETQGTSKPSSSRGEEAWSPEDAIVQVWKGEDEATGDFLLAALHENNIRCRSALDGDDTILYVLPEDETRAREIVREVAEGQPPE
jgi:hypothetical protein